MYFVDINLIIFNNDVLYGCYNCFYFMDEVNEVEGGGIVIKLYRWLVVVVGRTMFFIVILIFGVCGCVLLRGKGVRRV